jgi:hypothetical protein
MKKIDLHIHTSPAESERQFNFSMDCLRRYVEVRELDGIAVTNHNFFDVEQFREIRTELGIPVFPGIEIDLSGGQILVIGNEANLEEFNSKCADIEALVPSRGDSLSVDSFVKIFGDFSEYILIPHYEKKPAIKSSVLQRLGPTVTAGEVTSPKKFIRCAKDKARLVPVYFSDCRIEDDLSVLPIRQTYIDCGEVTFTALKASLRDRTKVALSPSEGNHTFQVFDDGQRLSTGLNVIIGERSSGKSHTLNKISDELPNVKYLPQFSLIERDEKKDEERFNALLSRRRSLLSREFLDDFEDVVREAIDVDIDSDSIAIERYVESLTKFARESERRDTYSKAKLFSEEDFPILEQKGLRELIASTENLIENIEYRKTIEKHVSVDRLKALIVDC